MLRRALWLSFLATVPGTCMAQDKPVVCTSFADRIPIMQPILRKQKEDLDRLKAFSQSELESDRRPLCDVVEDNLAFWREMLTEQQMCPDTSPTALRNRENAANMVIMYQQQADGIQCQAVE